MKWRGLKSTTGRRRRSPSGRPPHRRAWIEIVLLQDPKSFIRRALMRGEEHGEMLRFFSHSGFIRSVRRNTRFWGEKIAPQSFKADEKCVGWRVFYKSRREDALSELSSLLWRRKRDSNPRYVLAYTWFPIMRPRPARRFLHSRFNSVCNFALFFTSLYIIHHFSEKIKPYP